MKRRHWNKLLYSAAAGGALLAYAGLRSAKWPSFRGKTVLITGGSRGLGLVLARHLAREGARLALCARDREELDRAEAELKSIGADVYTVVCDVSNRADIDIMVSEVRQRFEHIDVLINNAGTIAVGPMDTMTLEDYRDAMDVHFWGPLHMILAIAPEMRRRRQGRIVNIASIGGKISVPHLLPYCASKFALVGLSKGLHAELKNDGVVVTTVCPGLMRTGSPENAIFKGKHKSEYAWFSISDSVPGISMDADRAARQILSASRRGDAEIILSIPAKLAAKVDALFPELSARVLSLASQILPSAGGIGSNRALGSESHSRVSPSWLTTLGENAARRNNETELEPRNA
jgi:short-subunit dehydrogenase